MKPTNLRVLQVIPTLSAGGAEGFATSLCLEMVPINLETKVFLLAGVRGDRGKYLHDKLNGAGIEVDGVEIRKPSSFSNIYRLNKTIRDWQPNIVHAHLYASEVACLVGRRFLNHRKTCYIRTLHSTDICGHRLRMMVWILNHFNDLTIACSESVVQAHLSFMKTTVDPRLMCIPNGARMLETVPNKIEKLDARSRFGIPEKSFVVAHVGRMCGGAKGTGLESEPKAQDILLRAFGKAFRGDEDCRLVLVGDGRLRPEAEALSQDLGISGQVIFLGEQPEPWQALITADMFCLPSRYEGLPLALLEAASCGLPVVASDIPEIRSLCSEESWILAPVDDVSRFAKGFLSVRENLDNFTQRANDLTGEIRKKYSMKTCAERYKQAYEQILE